MAQARAMQARLQALDPSTEVEIVVIKTSGDQGLREQLGAFVHELQIALLDNRIDVALHCLKDLPTEGAPGLRLVAHLEREDPRDTLIGPLRGIENLPEGAVVGTGSVRRSSQLAFIRPDLRFKPLVGNIDTRLRKLAEGEYHSIILAIAGLKRLGLLDSWAEGDHSNLTVEPLETDVMLPAPGQAVLVLECRKDDAAVNELCGQLNDAEAEAASTAERMFLKAFGGGCSIPVAAMAKVKAGKLELSGLVASPDGKSVVRGVQSGSLENPAGLGFALGQELGEKGAFEIIRSLTAEAR
ncbi:MAG: hydroxymethylbilane synthase [Armatimonadetes bacterium]|nr:hydroxymethylbilane synthase [Armatimonadota bacterium]